MKLNWLSEWIAITMLNKYVLGKASIFYMKYVVGKEKHWTLTTIFEGLFKYCFPKDFKLVLQRRLMLATQGKLQISDFIRDVEIMADRFPDINEQSIINIFWWGMNQQIRTRVVKMGINPEHSSLSKMVKYTTQVKDGMCESDKQQACDSQNWHWGQGGLETNENILSTL